MQPGGSYDGATSYEGGVTDEHDIPRCECFVDAFRRKG